MMSASKAPDDEISAAFDGLTIRSPQPQKNGGMFWKGNEFRSFQSEAGQTFSRDPFCQFEGQRMPMRVSTAFRPYRPRANAFHAITDDVVPESPLMLNHSYDAWSPDSVKAMLTQHHKQKVKEIAREKIISPTHARVQHEDGIICW